MICTFMQSQTAAVNTALTKGSKAWKPLLSHACSSESHLHTCIGLEYFCRHWKHTDSSKLISSFFLSFSSQFPHLSSSEQHLISNSPHETRFHSSPSPFHLPAAVIQITIFYLGCIFSLRFFFFLLLLHTLLFFIRSYKRPPTHTNTHTPPCDDM